MIIRRGHFFDTGGLHSYPFVTMLTLNSCICVMNRSAHKLIHCRKVLHSLILGSQVMVSGRHGVMSKLLSSPKSRGNSGTALWYFEKLVYMSQLEVYKDYTSNLGGYVQLKRGKHVCPILIIQPFSKEWHGIYKPWKMSNKHGNHTVYATWPPCSGPHWVLL